MSYLITLYFSGLSGPESVIGRFAVSNLLLGRLLKNKSFSVDAWESTDDPRSTPEYVRSVIMDKVAEVFGEKDRGVRDFMF